MVPSAQAEFHQMAAVTWCVMRVYLDILFYPAPLMLRGTLGFLLISLTCVNLLWLLLMLLLLRGLKLQNKVEEELGTCVLPPEFTLDLTNSSQSLLQI